MATKLWEQLDELNDEVSAKFGDLNAPFSLATTVVFAKPYKNITAGTKAIVVDRMKDYYALTVKGEYIEAIHKSYLKEVKK